MLAVPLPLHPLCHLEIFEDNWRFHNNLEIWTRGVGNCDIGAGGYTTKSVDWNSQDRRLRLGLGLCLILGLMLHETSVKRSW